MLVTAKLVEKWSYICNHTRSPVKYGRPYTHGIYVLILLIEVPKVLHEEFAEKLLQGPLIYNCMRAEVSEQ